MPRLIKNSALSVALMLSVFCSVASAQPTSLSAPLPEDSVLNGLVVEAPKVIERTRYGLVIQEQTMSVRVPYDDLDMRSPDGVAELDRRVTEAADLICRRLEIAYPDGSPERYFCAREAVRGARPQVIRARNAG
jgi:UrcA family protein